MTLENRGGALPENGSPLHILYLGADTRTALHRANALMRLGHKVHILNPEKLMPKNRWAYRLHYETGGLFIERHIAESVLSGIAGLGAFDLVWVDSGRYVGPYLIEALRRKFGCPVVNLNVDDPFGTRDRFSWSLYRRAVSAYDLIVVVRKENIAEAQAYKARQVLHIFRAADEVGHAPRPAYDPEAEGGQWLHEVLFLGTWMPERGGLMMDLLQRGVPLAIWGSRWEKAPEWKLEIFQKAWRGPNTTTDDEYARLIQGSKISLGLVSKGNRDLHTQRSLEIPYLGGLFCAERTTEHQQLYVEGDEAVFWDNAEECAAVCRELLADEPRRREIARRGRLRCLRNDTVNEAVARTVLAKVMGK